MQMLIKSVLLATLVVFTAGTTGCDMGTKEEPCQTKNTFVGDSNARHVVDVPLPFKPGPVAVLSTTEDGVRLSQSGQMLLSDAGTMLYVLDGGSVHAVDLAVLETHHFARIGGNPIRLTGSETAPALLVSDHERGSVWIVDQTRAGNRVEVPAGAGARAVALGPESRIAYVANENDNSLSLLDTGLSAYKGLDRSIIVGAATQGTVLVLDGDGRPKQEFTNLPSHIRDITVLPDGRTLAVSYSHVMTTGNPGLIGDGQVVLQEGVALLSLETGEVTLLPLRRTPEFEATFAQPTGLALVDPTTLAVALPGWSAVALYDVDPESETRGTMVGLIRLETQPRWLTAATLEGDWLYALDTDDGYVTVLDTNGNTTRTLSLQ